MSSRMLIAVVTLATPEISAVARLSEPNKRAYCGRHGYEFISLDRTLDSGRPPQWSKILLLLQHLDRFDWLFWSDADSLVMKPEMRLEELVAQHAAADLLITRDHHGVNTGQFLISSRNGRARVFLRAVYDQVQFVPLKPLSDQAAMTHVIDVNLAPVAVGYVPKRRLNAGVHDYRDGDFLLHYYGQPGRVYLMRKHLRGLGNSVSAGASSRVEVATGRQSATPEVRPSHLALLRKAQGHFEAGRATEAEATCREVLRRDPDNAAATHVLGLAVAQSQARAMNGRRADEAVDLLCRSVELAPKVPDFHNNLGSILHRACGLREEAAECFREALRLRPDFPAARQGLAEVTAGGSAPKAAPVRGCAAASPAAELASRAPGRRFPAKGDFSSPWSIDRDEYAFLVQFTRDLAAALPSRRLRVLEFGPGLSTFAFLDAGAAVVTLESDAGWARQAADALAGVDAARVLRYVNREDLRDIDLGGSGGFDLAFVDGPAVSDGEPFARFNTATFAAQQAPVVLVHDSKRERERRVIEAVCGQGFTLARTHDSRRGIAVLTRGRLATLPV